MLSKKGAKLLERRTFRFGSKVDHGSNSVDTIFLPALHTLEELLSDLSDFTQVSGKWLQDAITLVTDESITFWEAKERTY